MIRYCYFEKISYDYLFLLFTALETNLLLLFLFFTQNPSAIKPIKIKTPPTREEVVFDNPITFPVTLDDKIFLEA